MTDLRTITKDIHDAAEKTRWSRWMIAGELTQLEWAQHLFNLLELHQAIESRGIIDHSDLLRVEAIRQDLENIIDRPLPLIQPATWGYVEHLRDLPEELLWSHVYTHYLGMVFGGQMIKRSIKWPCTLLDFQDRQSCIAWLREKTVSADPAEAVSSFERTIDIYNQLADALRPGND
jgi:heme oxygenase